MPRDVTCFCVDGKNVFWIGTNEGLWRIDESEKDELDRVQCFRANACMLDNSVKAVEPDGKNGVWVLTETRRFTHWRCVCSRSSIKRTSIPPWTENRSAPRNAQRH